MNSLLAANLFASGNPLAGPPITQPLSQPSSCPAAPFLLNPVQLPTSAHQLNQHLVNLATTLHQQQHRNPVTTPVLSAPQSSLQPPKPPAGVPPPPPVPKPSDPGPSNASVCEPLAEKIRKLIEASSVRPLCEPIVEDEGAIKPVFEPAHAIQVYLFGPDFMIIINLGELSYQLTATFVLKAGTSSDLCVAGDLKMSESGRKSASADDEETGEAVRGKKGHRNGVMFEEARRMLSSSLKKVYRCDHFLQC